MHRARLVLGRETECRAETAARIQRKNGDGETFSVEERARRAGGPCWQAACLEIEEAKADDGEEKKCLRENEQQSKGCHSTEEEILGYVFVLFRANLFVLQNKFCSLGSSIIRSLDRMESTNER